MPENGMSEEDDDLLREEARQLSIKEALALLENQPYTPTKVTWLQKLGKANQWLSSERSVFSMKVAAAATVFATLSGFNFTYPRFQNTQLYHFHDQSSRIPLRNGSSIITCLLACLHASLLWLQR